MAEREGGIWTIGAVFVALVAAGAISAYRYARVWTPLERNYLTAYLATDAGNGNITFSITAKANWVSPFTHYTIGPVILAGENSTWNNLLGSVQGYCQSPVGNRNL